MLAFSIQEDVIILTSQVPFAETVKNAQPDVVGGTVGIITIP